MFCFLARLTEGFVNGDAAGDIGLTFCEGDGDNGVDFLAVEGALAIEDLLFAAVGREGDAFALVTLGWDGGLGRVPFVCGDILL